MKKFISISMLVSFVLTLSLTSFAASMPQAYTSTPKANEVMIVTSPSMTEGKVMFFGVKYVIRQGDEVRVYTTDWGMRSFKSNQCHVAIVSSKILPSDIRRVEYTYNTLAKKFTKLTAKK
jgi:peroxiredoxin family protein